MYAKPSSSLDSQAPNVLVADCEFLLVGTKERSARAAEGTCNRLDSTLCGVRETRILPGTGRRSHAI